MAAENSALVMKRVESESIALQKQQQGPELKLPTVQAIRGYASIHSFQPIADSHGTCRARFGVHLIKLMMFPVSLSWKDMRAGG